MPSIQEELAALRSRKLTSKEAHKLKDAAPMSTPEAVEAALLDHKVNLKHVDTIVSATSAPTGKVTVDLESNFYLQQSAKKREDKMKKQEAAEHLRSYALASKTEATKVKQVPLPLPLAQPTTATLNSKPSSPATTVTNPTAVEKPPPTPPPPSPPVESSSSDSVHAKATVPAAGQEPSWGSGDATIGTGKRDDTFGTTGNSKLDPDDDGDDDLEVPNLDLVPTDVNPSTARMTSTVNPDVTESKPIQEQQQQDLEQRQEQLQQQQQQNRSEKKSRKIMQKLGLRPVPGIIRATFKIKRSTNVNGGIFVISKPDVYSADSTTLVIFGQATTQDQRGSSSANTATTASTSASASASASSKFPLPNLVKEEDIIAKNNDNVAVTALENRNNQSAVDTMVVDETGVSNHDIELVMTQSGCSRTAAVNALRENDGDLINAIMSLSDYSN